MINNSSGQKINTIYESTDRVWSQLWKAKLCQHNINSGKQG